MDNPALAIEETVEEAVESVDKLLANVLIGEINI